MRNKKFYLAVDAVTVVLLLALDQLTKHLAIVYLKNNQPLVLIKGVLELQYLENRGSAFGILQGQKIFLLLTGIIFMAVLLGVLFRVPAEKKYVLVHICLAAVIAGGLGNIWDRLRFDYVVDFISFVLIHFPIFNVADCYIVVSTIGLFLLFLFVFRDEDLEFLNFRRKRQKETQHH
ncbi:MAG: signal peptidase II [Acetatifactor sp.]|nr:signal peptidase II [Acetatifactor sp.]